MSLARKHRVELEGLGPTDETVREMPVWLHHKASEEAARICTTDAAKCLRNSHCTHYVRQSRELIENVPSEHQKTNFYACKSCKGASTRIPRNPKGASRRYSLDVGDAKPVQPRGRNPGEPNNAYKGPGKRRREHNPRSHRPVKFD